MVIREALREGAQLLKPVSDTPMLDSRLLLSTLLSCDNAALLLHHEEQLADEVYAAFQALLQRRANHEPIAYLTGQKEFMGLAFAVAPGVLIPRPDTETLVEWVLEAYAERPVSVLDIGTGSGCIAVSIAALLPQSRVAAMDISPRALEIAEENARQHRAAVSFFQADILQDALTGTYDLIVSNPPYITEAEKDLLEPDVLDFEPHGALFGGEDGLLFYRTIIEKAPDALTDGGTLALEIGYRQARAVTELCKKRFETITVLQDLAGNDRVVLATGKIDRKE